MKSQQNTRRTHLVLALAGLGLVATACGAETAASTPVEPVPTAAAPTTTAPTTTAPIIEAPATTTVPATVPPTTAPPTTAPTTVPPPTVPPTVPPTDPEPPVIDDVTYEDETGPCTVSPMPADAVIGGEIWFEDGLGEHRIVSYSSAGTWKLRAEFAFGAGSEIEIPGAGVHGVRPIGFADVDLTYGGEELLAAVGGGASTVEVGFFTFLEGACIHRYQSALGGDFSIHVGATTESGTGLQCGEGYVVDWGYSHDGDDTYSTWSAAFEPVALPVFGYMPASDAFDEGLTLDEVTATPLFDCAGLEL